MYDKKACDKFRKNNLEKIKARDKLNWVFRNDKKSNNFICGMCGKISTQKHHENYDLPFVFIPLCVKCHGKIHRRN